MDDTIELSEWETCGERDALVPIISSCRLFLSVRGPPRKANQPVVICESGSASGGNGWFTLARLLAPHVRVYYYDRAGTGSSDTSNMARTASNMAAELAELLSMAHIRPPYITVAHSYGGLITRELLARFSSDAFAGMVFVDAVQEKTFETLQIPYGVFSILFENMDFFEVTGHNRDHRLTPEEYASLMAPDENAKANKIAEKEQALFTESSEALEEKRQFETQPLGQRPVTAIAGNCAGAYCLMLKDAAARDIGSPEERAEFEAFVKRVKASTEPLQREQLRLSTSASSRFIQGGRNGHYPQWTEPQLVADEVLLMFGAAV
ncbi:hypothetical protein LTR85_001098 [Meristemomyces frigidus]|nr:hypothetical protein LTR85_001098 [Meristemomyces frigidus]